jgi:hypothetical protein
MLDLKTKADLQRLVDERLEESLTLDYKASPSLSRDGKNPEELCKDVSALANSAGGQLIYGVEEDKGAGKPSRVDDGVSDPKITKEWIDQILNSRIQPRMDGVRIERIDMQTGKFGYVISVQQSQTGPHQAPDGKYYKRFNFQSVPMHDYEIKDIMRRSTTPNLEIELSLPTNNKIQVEFPPHMEFSKTFFLGVKVINKSPTPAMHVIVEVYVDAAMKVPFPPIEFTQRGAVSNPHNLRIYRWTLSSPPGLPVFEGADHESHFAQIPLQLPSALLHSSIIRFETDVRSPGFTNHERWAILSRGGILTLYPPTHSFVTTS